MKMTKTEIEDLIVIEPKTFGDDRGYFLESFNKKWFNENVTETNFIQDNESKSSRGVLRGLHFQMPPFSQSKLVRVIQGEVLDVVVDLRKESKTYGRTYSIILNSENKKQLFVPRGFGHGFSVLSESAIFSYKVDNHYSPEHEGGIIWNDKTLNIDWNLNSSEVKLAEKDKKLQAFDTFNTPF